MSFKYKSIFPSLGALLVLAAGCGWFWPTGSLLSAEVVGTRPHDPSAYTQGLQLHEGRLWESTGLYGQSTVREVNPASGVVLRKHELPARFFGEGLTIHKGELWLLTWRERTAFVLNPETFETIKTHLYDGEGWGLTSDGTRLIMSDGTSALQFRNPEDFSLIKKMVVKERGKPVNNLNELEFFDGSIWANVYQTDRIIRIDARSGNVTGSVDLSSLRTQLPVPHRAEALNGIAHDSSTGNLLITGKWWPLLFELQVR
jgi:glutamine cyclotransferase